MCEKTAARDGCLLIDLTDNQMVKRLLDIMFSFAGLAFVLPLFVPIALSIKIDSKGPVFFKAKRIGRYGKPFEMYKFRTMVVDAQKLGGSATPEDDPRITKVGRFLRKYEFDELPQLINVLMGEMSFVGPRPEVEEYTRLYSEEEKVVFNVTPGMTDYSSIKFINLNKILARSDDQAKDIRENIMPEKSRLRIKYALNNSLWIDFQILFQTLKKVVRDKWSTKG